MKKNGESTKTNSNLAGALTEALTEIACTAISSVISEIVNNSPKNTHGPVVKTGPTAGNNRSRNKNGRWHKKRSDAGIKRK